MSSSDSSGTAAALHVPALRSRRAAAEGLEEIAEQLCATFVPPTPFNPDAYARAVIRHTVSAFRADQVAITFNGGKDAVVMLEEIIREMGMCWVRECHIFVLVDDEHEFPELIEFRKDYVAKRLTGVQFHSIDARDGMQSGLRRALDQFPFSAVFMGTRKDDPSGKYQPTPWRVTTAGWPPMIRVCPILPWTFTNVWEFIKCNGIPFCTLYSAGYTSLGDASVTSPNSRLQRSDGSYNPAWMLTCDEEERAGRVDITQ